MRAATAAARCDSGNTHRNTATINIDIRLWYTTLAALGDKKVARDV